MSILLLGSGNKYGVMGSECDPTGGAQGVWGSEGSGDNGAVTGAGQDLLS